ncbi:GH3 domain-containing protein [Paraliomyxa miuraensis]|uniref:GH3 auxin-responsive promoter family protein n=1 Tax=Paraliomyxa miuraensis TaxID=376150 RepID=UPI00224E6265|nr:GH3 auxin-responsive promoter family protein [Paraliomyxa miuraensis]MCX4246576.1 GH3 auxin-responsive promoter family protein [Paraliomyxa miuraensis]
MSSEASARQHCLAQMIEHLGLTRLGRELGLARLRSLDDLRASLPILDRERHEREVEQHLGFGLVDSGDAQARELSGGGLERDAVISTWQAFLRRGAVRRVALLRGHNVDPMVDRIARDDVRALDAEVLPLDHVDDPAAALERLGDFDPELMLVPSVLTLRWLEAAHRGALERRLRSLRMVLAEHDMGQEVRSRVRVAAAGWIHRSGRLGLPTLRPPLHALTLAVGSQIIELLPYGNPEEDARRVYASETVLPEHAVMGQRYELVVSSPLGFLRLRTDEHVRVVGFDPPTDAAPFPRPRVVRLAPAPPDVALEGCTVAGAWLTASIRQAFLREDPAVVAAEIGPDPRSVPRGVTAMQTAANMRLPDAFKDTELGWMARTGSQRVERHKPRALLVRVEVQGYVAPELTGFLSKRIDSSLRRHSPAYDYLRQRDELQPPRVMVLPAGTRRSEEDRRIRELVGGVWVPDVRVVGM